MEPEIKRNESLPVFGALYLIGVPGGALFYSLVRLGKIEVRNPEKLFRIKSGSLVLCNHPSLLEPFLIGFLFARLYLRHPRAHLPWSTPDIANFYRQRWYWLLRRISLPITRSGNTLANRETLRQMLRIAKGQNGDLILFAEGGRTSTAEAKGKVTYSEKGKALGEIRDSIGNLATRFKCVVPIWIQGTELIFPNNQKTSRALKGKWLLPQYYLMAFVKLFLSRKSIVIKIGDPFIIP